MAKLKPKWQKTDIPKSSKIKLWQIMKDNPTQISYDKAIAHLDISKEEERWIYPLSRDTWRSLKREIIEMPYEEVISLPQDLQDWILQLRPDLKYKNNLEEHSKILAEVTRVLAEQLRSIKQYAPEKNEMIGALVVDYDQPDFLEFWDDFPAKALLSHLQAELPELQNLDRWGNLRVSDITEGLLDMLSVKAIHKEFQGKCAICEDWV